MQGSSLFTSHNMKSYILALGLIVCISVCAASWIPVDSIFADADDVYPFSEVETYEDYEYNENEILPTPELTNEIDTGIKTQPEIPDLINKEIPPEYATTTVSTIDEPEVNYVDKLAEKVDGLLLKLNEQQDKIIQLEKDKKKLEDKIDMVEQQTKTNSVIFFNVREGKNENHRSTLQKILHIINRMMKIKTNPNDISVALRAESNSTQHRPIVVRFTNFATKMRVLGASGHLRRTNILVVGDYSEQVALKRSQLLPYLHSARAKGQNAFLLYDKLVVNGVKMTLEDLEEQTRQEAENPEIESQAEDLDSLLDI